MRLPAALVALVFAGALTPCLAAARAGDKSRRPRGARARGGRSHSSSAAASKELAAATKARVEAGEGVPFFDERLSCRKDGGAWSEYSELVHYSRLRIFSPAEGSVLFQALTEALAERTGTISEILQCNVGVIAGFHLLARRHLVVPDDWRAYRLLQLALIWVFTLRNALQIPPAAAQDWATRTDQIVQEIRLLRQRLGREQARRLALLPQVTHGLRLPELRIAIVSICAYPKDHPLVLRTLTPENRQAYAARHGYALHVHLTHPMPDRGYHIQHAKLALMANYLKSGDYDWVAWLDCDSIIMNFDRTLDSIIYRYARQSARAPQSHSDGEGSEEGGGSAEATGQEAPLVPFDDEELEAYVSHVGSCNSEAGCYASTQLVVNPHVQYTVSVLTALIDMEGEDERLSSLSVGGFALGDCNPLPESDFDCGFFECFEEWPVPMEAVASGVLLLEVNSVKTNNDCACNLLFGTCYNAALAAYEEATDGEKATDPSYGMFVKFILTPRAANATSTTIEPRARAAAIDAEDQDDRPWEWPEGCSCRLSKEIVSKNEAATLPWSVTSRGEAAEPSPPEAFVRRRNVECDGPEILLSLNASVGHCLDLCRLVEGCSFVAHGIGRKRGRCYWEMGDCVAFEEDSFVVYDIGVDAHDVVDTHPDCSRACAAAEPMPVSDAAEVDAGEAAEGQAEVDIDESEVTLAAAAYEPLDGSVDLLITDEGWGLSSANWLIRRSEWSINFLERAFTLCHDDMPLFGDQDAMIHLLFHEGAVSHGFRGDPLDSHAVIIPQRELNSYDALNAHHMGADDYQDGDLLVTFPGCKDPDACNPLFRLAVAHAGPNGARKATQKTDTPTLTHFRLFGPPEVAAEVFDAARNHWNNE